MNQMDETFDPIGPHFLSYRQQDGTQVTDEIMWRLRAAGVLVWRDAADLSPGDTETRLEEALADGLAGGILVITEDVANSRIVRELEAPRLIELAAHSSFGLAIANDVVAWGEPDYGAPDRLLGRDDGKLAGFVQDSVASPDGMRQLVERVRRLRVRNLRERVAACDGWLRLSVQTRNSGASVDRTGAALDLRVRPARSGRLPDATGLRYFADSAPGIADAVIDAGASKVRLSGGAHLSVALALGVLLPTTRIGRIEVLDQYDQTWSAGAPAFGAEPDLLHVAEEHITGADDARAVAVYLDLMPMPNDGAWLALLDQVPTPFAAAVHVRPAADGMLDPGRGAALAGTAAAVVRELTYRHAGAEAHIVYRGPFGLAPLIGRLLNTVRGVLYEWDDTGESARYVPTLRTSPADQSRPVETLLHD
ncbi:SAVED domain-containing protein [Cellulomonas triticagri]|nr:SAVED domain-containing protein [Cellulomonas triticagri]